MADSLIVPRRRRGRRIATTVLAALLLAGSLSGCDGEAALGGVLGGEEPADEGPAKVRLNVGKKQSGVPVSHVIEARAVSGSLTAVTVTSPAGEVTGSLSEDGTRWRADQRLEPGTTYTVQVTGANAAGEQRTRQRRFTTQELSLDQQTYASIAPLDGATVGVGMPVIVRFDLAVTDRAAFEREMRVTSEPAQKGTWHWVSDHEAHWRPKRYWRPGTTVSVDVAVNGVDAGNGIYGQESRSTSFTVGDKVIHKVDVGRHEMRTYLNGSLVRTTPISAGKPGFTTRSGTKVIMEKHRHKTMNAATLGYSPGHPEYYNMENVEYAMRVTSSGEFLHAAPWSVGSQGRANVSHGCVGMSTADARWVYESSQIGDVVEVTGTDRQMDLYNGWGDWNASFADYRAGSAL